MSENKAPAARTYRPRKTTTVIAVVGAIMMIIGVLTAIFGIVVIIKPELYHLPGEVFVLSGIGCVLFASMLYIISNLSGDVHELAFDIANLYDENVRFHKSMTERMDEVDRELDAIKKGIATISGKMPQ